MCDINIFEFLDNLAFFDLQIPLRNFDINIFEFLDNSAFFDLQILLRNFLNSTL